MCLQNLLSNEELKAFKRGLKREFDVFKVMSKFNYPEFFQLGENQLKRKGIHRAQQRGLHRKALKGYKAGFHAFLTQEDAEKYNSLKCVKKFRARRSWITAKGNPEFNNTSCVVLDRIEVI